MTVVLVHGNPVTDAIWNPLVDALGRDDVVRLSPPGFGAPLPDEFPATYTCPHYARRSTSTSPHKLSVPSAMMNP